MSKHLETRRLWSGLVLMGCWLLGPTAFGQRLPSDIVHAASGAAYQKQIDAFVKDAVAKINSTDPAAQKSGRETLANQAAAADATAGFFDAYATSINKELVASNVAGHADVRVRLNAAVVVARVSASGARFNSVRLVPIVALFLKDKANAVCLWGMKAADSIIPAMLGAGQDPKALAGLVVDALKEHADCAECAEEASVALSLGGAGTTAKVSNAVLMRNYVQFPMNLIEYRIGQYGKDAEHPVPPAPMAENTTISFLVSSAAWSAMSPVERGHALRLMCLLLDAASPQLATAEKKDEVVDLIRHIGQGTWVAGDSEKNPALAKAGENLSKIPNDPDATDLASRIDAVKAAVKALNLPGATAVAAP